MAEDLVSRPYQEQLEEIASRKNTIIHLPTGSGKTFIAVCLIRRFREALQAPWGQGGKRTFFLVNTVPLVNQQKKVIETLCPVEGVGAYSGDIGVDHWDKVKWNTELENNQVIVMTSQILSDMLNHSYIKIEDINLLIFDECHHAVVDHPMRLIMKHFENCHPMLQPRVLGLTATLLNSNVTLGHVQVTLQELEKTFHATIATVNELGEVLTYSTNPNESVQYHDSFQPTAAMIEANKLLDKAIDFIMATKIPCSSRTQALNLKPWQIDISTDSTKIIKATKNMILSMKMLMQEFGPFGGNLAILAYVLLLERLRRKATTQQEHDMYKTTISICTEARTLLTDSMENDTGYDKIVKHSSQKILQLLSILREYSPNVMNKPGVLLRVNQSKKPLSAIIFTQQRFTAKVLYNLLKGVIDVNPEEFGFLKHDFIVGLNANPMKATRESHFHAKVSQKALLMFGRSELNCMISTSVIEEGVDIPQCLLVLRFDPPLEYRSYIQSKGRARSKDSNFILMVNNSDREKFNKNYSTFQRIEQEIHVILVGNTDQRHAPSDNDLQDLYEEDILLPYVTPQGGRLPAVASVSLLHRYFSTMPHDQFTQINPAWIHEIVMDEETNLEMRLITIIFPVSCPIKEPIKGFPQRSLKNAKRSAALNACIKLHQEGELDSVSLLPRDYGVVDFDEVDVKDCFQNWPWEERDDEKGEDVPKPGSKKCVRRHKIQFPKCLETIPDVKRYYLHIIKLTPAFPKPGSSRDKVLYDFITEDHGYGILTPNPLPKLCQFPTFMTVGEVTTEIQMNYAMIDMNDQMLTLIKRFHFFLFDEILAIAKKFLVFEGKVNCLYVVPVKGSHNVDIDWDVMQKYDSLPPTDVPDVTERRAMKVTEENYKFKVVTPWYRGLLLPDRYVVTNVLEHMTPNSFFKENSDETFAYYYYSKYNLELLGDKKQPLLEVRSINSRMNCLLPRAATIKSFTDKQAKLVAISFGDDRPKGGYNEIFVPEFCIAYDYPGVLWYKAVMLPSILHRLHMMLIAQEFLIEASVGMQYGTPILPKNEEWAPIEVFMPIAIDSLLSNIEEPTKGSNAVDRINQPICPNGAELPKILSMKESLYQLQKKKISADFPWEEHMEPMDIERNVALATKLDVESYDDFVSFVMRPEKKVPEAKPLRRIVNIKAAIKPPPLNTDETVVADENGVSHPGPSRKRSCSPSSDSSSSFRTCKSLDSSSSDSEDETPKKKKSKANSRTESEAEDSNSSERYVEKIAILEKTPTGRGPELRDILSALTTINSSDTFCLERAETLGDSFLKYAATIYLFHKFAGRDEGQLSNIKGRLISNRNLYYAGERLNIGGRMKIEPFAPKKDFMVPGFFAPQELEEFITEKKIRPTFLIGIVFSKEEALRGIPKPENVEMVKRRYTDGDAIAETEPQGGVQNAMQCYLHSQAVSDKSVADCVEALIGTYLLSGGIKAAVKFVEWMQIFPAKDKLVELLHKPIPTVVTEKKATINEINFLMYHCRTNLEEIVGYKFRDPAFLLEAVSHASFIRNRLTRSYERLEFLGDAILDFLITSHIFENNRNLKPGQLTDLRSALVNNVTFAAYVVKLGLHKYICKELNPQLDKAIMAFVDHQVARNHEIVEDVLYLIDEEECPMAEYVEVPKTLSDVFESLAGAIYLDSGGDLQKVWSVFYRIMCNEISEFSQQIPRQPVTILYEMVHACPKFGESKLVNPDCPGISKVNIPVTFTKKDKMCTVYGIGANKSQAKRAAAKLALKILNA